jgi:hypothetical protein
MGQAFPQMSAEDVEQINTFYAKCPVLVRILKNRQGRGTQVTSGLFSFTYNKELHGYSWVFSWSTAVLRADRTSTLEAALEASQVALNKEGQQLAKLKVTL